MMIRGGVIKHLIFNLLNHLRQQTLFLFKKINCTGNVVIVVAQYVPQIRTIFAINKDTAAVSRDNIAKKKKFGSDVMALSNLQGA